MPENSRQFTFELLPKKALGASAVGQGLKDSTFALYHHGCLTNSNPKVSAKLLQNSVPRICFHLIMPATGSRRKG